MQRGSNLAKQVAVYTEKTLRREGGAMYKVAELIIHPRRDEKTKAFDQALLRLERSIQVSDRAQPICLPEGGLANPSPGSKVMVSGWGSVDPNQSWPSEELKFVWLKVISMKEEAELCYSQLSFTSFIFSLSHSNDDLKEKHNSGWSRIALLKWNHLKEITCLTKVQPSAPSALSRTTVQVMQVDNF